MSCAESRLSFANSAAGSGGIVEASILPMTDGDLPAVIELWSQTAGVGLNESDTIEQVRAYLVRNPGLSLVAKVGSQIVAAVLCGYDGRRGCLYHLAVLPSHRNQGLGRQLVSSCLASLAELGILRCNIFVYADNEAGHQFWNRCGWSMREDLRVLQCRTGGGMKT
jgi:putative acetyltransferase